MASSQSSSNSEASSINEKFQPERDEDVSPGKLEAGGRRSSMGNRRMSAGSRRMSMGSRRMSAVEVASAGARWTKDSTLRHFNQDLNTKRADFVVLICWFMTGFLDSTIFQAYRTFVSMQTGNTIFIALSAAATTIRPSPNSIPIPVRPYGWLKSLISLMAFLVGSIFFARLGGWLGGSPSRRWTLTCSFMIQTSFILLSAILVQTGVVESRLEYIGEDINWLHLIPIALLSFQAPAQVACGRAFGMPEVSTVVVTTMVYDFGSDPNLFVGLFKNPVRNRRFLGWVCMLIGAILGGFLTVTTRHVVETLWVASAVKAACTLMWVVWPSKTEVIEDDES